MVQNSSLGDDSEMVTREVKTLQLALGIAEQDFLWGEEVNLAN